MPGKKIREERKDKTKRIKDYCKQRKYNEKVKEVIEKEFNGQVIKIKEWEDLYGLENDRYKVESDNEYTGNGWIVDKENYHNNIYLSTHFFYKNSGSGYDEILRECGFNVEVERN